MTNENNDYIYVLFFRNAKRKKIAELPDRDQRHERRQWRKYDKTRRQKKKDLAAQARALTPPITPPLLGQNGNKKRGRKVVLKNKSKCVRQNKKLQEEVRLLKEKLKLEKSKTDCLRKRYSRLKSTNNKKLLATPNSELTPQSKAKKQILQSFDKKTSGNNNLMQSKVARKLVFHNVLVSSIQSTYKKEKSAKKKRVISTIMMNNLIMRYRLQSKASKALGLRAKKRLIMKEVAKQNMLRQKIHSFFLSDDISRTTAGIKETITRNKVKQQRRYLNASMSELYKDFVQENGKITSYTTFTRMRPFYVLKPSDLDRDTCLCKIHTNIELKTNVLKQYKVIEESNPHKLTEVIACDKSSANCMYGKCIHCKDKMVPVNIEKPNERVSWHEWQIINQLKTKNIGGSVNVREVKVSAKVKIDDFVEILESKFQKDMKKFKMHIFNIKKQNEAYKLIRENLNDHEAVIHIDFSENFACKYASEVQSFHFGSSRKQASLHTGVVYLPKTPKPICFASVSSCLSHEPPAIWAHLKPLLSFLREDFPNLTTLHFFSDGPSSQYRQKKNFYYFSHLTYDFGFKNASWSFFEASHGKGAPDGVGGALKRMANSFVAHGNDIKDAESLFELLTNNSNVKMFYVSEKDVNDIALLLPKTVPAIKGTLLIHQIHTCKKGKLSYREVSCFCKKNSWDTGKLCNCLFVQKGFSFPSDKSTTSNTGQKKISKTKKSVFHDIYSSSASSESDDSFSTQDSTDIEDVDLQNLIASEDEVVLLEPEVSQIKQGTHVLVQFVGGNRKATKYRYVAVCQKAVEEDGEVQVTCLKVVSGTNAKVFKVDENDTSYVDFSQIIGILPNPKLVLKGNRVFYEFENNVDVFERS